MNHSRKAKKEEIDQLTKYIMNQTNYSKNDAKEIVERTMYVAVFDYYVDYGYAGPMMVVVGDDSVSEVFIWDTNGQIHSTFD